MVAENKQIMDKLNEIQSDLSYIKKHISDLDAVLTDEDIQALDNAEQELKSGKTKRLA